MTCSIADGSEIYLKPIEDYVAADRQLTFYTVVESARQRGEIAIGYRRHAQVQQCRTAIMACESIPASRRM